MMDWTAVAQFILTYVQKNPALVENFLTAIINHLVSNPTLMQELLNAIVARVAPKAS